MTVGEVTVPRVQAVAPSAPAVSGLWTDFGARFGLVVVAGTALLAVTAPIIAPHSYITLFHNFLPPGAPGHPLGTDSFGRDILSYLVWGARVSFIFGFGAAAISLLVGTVVGSIPAYLGGWVDDLFARLTDILLVIPTFFLIIIVIALFGHNIAATIVIVGLTIWPSNAKVVRAQVHSLKARGFVQAARVSGASDVRIVLRHILPNGLSAVVANATLQVGFAILYEASLSFIGLGDPNQPSWGQLLFIARETFATAWWIAVFPGAAIVCLVLGINLLGDEMMRAIRRDRASSVV